MEDQDICSICYDELTTSQTFRLDCSHIFHSTCIIEWFRRGNKSCPYCKNTGDNNNTTPNNVIDLIIENNNLEDWERHPDVQNFLNIIDNNDLTKQIIISAYIKRNEGMNINLEDTYNNIIVKLGLSDDLINQNIEFKYKMFVKEKIDENIHFEIKPNYFKEFKKIELESDLNKNKKLKFRQLENCYNSNNFNFENIYNILNKDDLLYMGW